MGQGCFRSPCWPFLKYYSGSNRKQISFDHNIASSSQEKSEIFCISFHLSNSAFYGISLKCSPSKIQCSVAGFKTLGCPSWGALKHVGEPWKPREMLGCSSGEEVVTAAQQCWDPEFREEAKASTKGQTDHSSFPLKLIPDSA